MSFPSDEAVQAAREAVGSKLGGAGAFAAIAVDEPKIRADERQKILGESTPLTEHDAKVRADERAKIVEWLRSNSATVADGIVFDPEKLADDIEREFGGGS